MINLNTSYNSNFYGNNRKNTINNKSITSKNNTTCDRIDPSIISNNKYFKMSQSPTYVTKKINKSQRAKSITNKKPKDVFVSNDGV